MAKAIAVTKLGVVGGTVYNVGNYVLEATIADAVVAAGLATVTQADVPDDIDLSTPEALLNAMGDTPSLVIVSASVTTKPSSPNEKDVYIVPAGSAWAALDEAYDNQLALFERGGWKYITPKFGWQVRNKADNGVLWYDGDSWEVSGSGGGGSGTVTSVGLSLPNIFTISGSPVTTSGTLAATLANQSANQIFAGPSSGGAAAPSFRSLVAADIPDISGVYATKAYAEGLVVGLLDDRGNFDASSDTFPAAGGSGSGGAVLKGDLWTISVAGTLGGTAVTPGDIVRALADSPGQTASNWAVSETNIGYAALNASLNSGQIYVGNGSNVGTARTLSGDVTMNNTGVTAIGNAKVTNAMLAGSIDLTTKVTGVLPVTNGGTGLSALGSALQVLRVNAGGTALEFATASGGITVGTTTITGGTSGRLPYNNGGVYGESNLSFASSALTFTRDAIGATSTDGFTLINTTAAAAGAQQYSPRLRLTGQGWKTNATAASQTVDWIAEVRPVQGAASPTANLALLYQIDGGGFASAISTGQILVNGGASVSQSVVQYSAVNNTNYGLKIGGGNAGNAVSLVANGTESIGYDANANVVYFKSNAAFGAGNGSGVTAGWVSPNSSQLRLYGASGGQGSLIIGSASVGSIGTSGVGVLAIANGTAPSSSPADEFQLYSADWNGAGTAAAHFRNEEGHVVKICSQAVAALTNNVSSGGTNDQVDNWTDLATYATDAAAIRNAIFQLSRKLAEVVTAQRTNGLFR